MKEITQADINKLVQYGYIQNTNNGYIDTKSNYQCGVYRTKKKRYIEDKYVEIAKTLK